MLIPLGTDRGVRRSALVTPALVVATVVCSCAMFVLQKTDPDLHARLLHQLWVVGGDEFRWWQPVTATLLHGDLLHLAGNVLFLWVFGQAVEDRFGRLGFLALYVAGAYASGLAHAGLERAWFELPSIVTGPEAVRVFAESRGITEQAAREILESARAGRGMWVPVPAVGASGAIAAVTGAFLVLFPRTTIRCFWIFGLNVIGVPAWWFIGLAIAWNVFAQGLGVDRGVAYLAHLGGYAFGFGCAFVLLALRVFPREPYDLFTVFRQAHRRRQFRAASATAVPRPQAAAARPSVQTRSIDELAERRAEVSRLLAEGDEPAAVEAYRALVRDYAHRPGPTTLSRSAQYRVAAYLYQHDRYAEAGEAYERFLDAYPGDREADAIRVLLARLWGVHLGRGGDAREALGRVIEKTADPDVRALAEGELAALAGAEEDGA